MLPASRIRSVLLIGLAMVLVAWGALGLALAHVDSAVPLDVEHSTLVLTDDAARIKGQESTLTHQSHISLLDPHDQDSVTVRVGETWLQAEAAEPGATDSAAATAAGTDLDRLLGAQITVYRMDRRSGAAVGPALVVDQLAAPNQEVPLDGVWTKFPAATEEKTYDFYDSTARTAFPAEYRGKQQRDGRTLLTFSQDIKPVNVATLYNSYRTTTTITPQPTEDNPEPAPEQAYLFHSAQRTITVDQLTGMIVDFEEKVHDYYATREDAAAGGPTEDLLDFHATMAPEASQALLEQAAQIHTGNTLTIVHWGMVGVGVVLAAVGLAGAVGRLSTTKKR